MYGGLIYGRECTGNNLTMIIRAYISRSVLLFLLFFSAVSIFSAVPVRIAVPALGEGLSRLKQWTPIVETLENKCGIDLDLIITRDNYVIEEGFRSKYYDLAFVDSFWYFIWKREKLCRAVVQAEIAGSDTRRIMLIVHKDSILRRTEDLKDKSIAFTLKNESAAGFYLPLAMLLSENVDPFTYFKENIFSETFLSILKGVAYGKLDAGFITSNIIAQAENKQLAGSLRVILESSLLPQWVLIEREDFDKKVVKRIMEVLADLSEGKEGRAVLKETGFSGFEELTDDALSPLAKYIRVLEENHAAPE